MARSKSKVTFDNALSVMFYFEQTFNDSSRLTQLKKMQSFADFDARYEAQRAFDTLRKHNVLFNKDAAESDKLAYLEALQAWLDKYILLADWQRCLTTIRQQDFRRRKKIKALKLSSDAYYKVYFYAKKLGVTLEEAVCKAIDLADNENINM